MHIFLTRLHLLTLSFLFFSGSIFSQSKQQQIDRLTSEIAKTTDPLSKSDMLSDLARLYQFDDIVQAKSLMREALQIAEAEDSREYIAKCKTRMSGIYWLENKLDSAEIYSQTAIDLIEGLDFPDIEASNYSNLAMYAEERGNYEEAIAYYDHAITIPVENRFIIMALNNNVGNLYSDLNYTDKALSHQLKGMAVAHELNNTYGIALLSTNIGISYRLLGEYQKAIESFQTTIELQKEIGHDQSMVDALSGLALVYKEMDSLDKSVELLQDAIEIAKNSPNQEMPLESLIDLGDTYILQGNLQAADETFQECLTIPLEENAESNVMLSLIHIGLSNVYMQKGQYRQALEAAKKGIAFYGKTEKDVSSELIGSYRIMAESQFHLGQHQQAFQSLKQESILSDSLNIIQNIKETKTLELKYSISEKEKEMAVMEAQKNAEIQSQKSTNRLYLIMVGIALLSAGLLFYFLRQRTQQKRQLEQQNETIAKQTEELQQLDNLKSRLFANVSHELRTPLTLILGPLSSALKAGKLDTRTSTFLKLAQQSGQKLLQLVNEILDLSKMDAGKLELVEKPVQLLPFLQRLIAQFESHAQSKGIDLGLSFHPDAQLQILLDAHKFELVFNNLVSNALKFTPKGGQVSVLLTQHNNQLSMLVNDTGPGIPEKDLVQVFDRFYQSSHSENQAGGTGIGLALCHEYARLFQGSVLAENRETGGASFHFAFPLKEVKETVQEEAKEAELIEEQPQEEVIATTQESSTLKGKHILLVEDNFSLRSYIQTVLGDHFRMTTAENGQEALDILRQNEQKIDLILSDVMMPVMDGFQFLEHLKAHEQWRNIPVVMLTARAELKDKLKALRIGVDDYMTKPFDEEELLVRVHNLLQHAQQRAIAPQELAEIEEAEEVAEERQPQMPEEDLQWLQEVEDITKRLISDFQFGVDELAYQIGASRSKLHRKMKLLTGLTPNHYIIEVRLQQARFFLETRQLSSVKATSLEVGFKDIKYFSQKFKKRFGKLPSEYLVT